MGGEMKHAGYTCMQASPSLVVGERGRGDHDRSAMTRSDMINFGPRLLPRTLVVFSSVVLHLLVETCVSQTTGPACSWNITDANDILNLEQNSINSICASTAAEVRKAAAEAWNSSTGISSVAQMVTIGTKELDFSGDDGLLECKNGGILVLQGSQKFLKVTVRGLDIRLSHSSCQFVAVGLKLEECGQDGRGDCIHVTTCPLVAVFDSIITLVEYSSPPIPHSTILLESVNITCTNCTAFPTFSANIITANRLEVQCVPAGSCSVNLSTPLSIVRSSLVSVFGYSFSQCSLPISSIEQPSCLPLTLSSVLFSNCDFGIPGGTQTWLRVLSPSHVKITNSDFSFYDSGSSMEHTWPIVGGNSVLSNVQFSCSSSHQCQLREPKVSFQYSYDISISNFRMYNCHTANCLRVTQSTNITVRDCSFDDATQPFIHFVDSQWTVQQTHFSNLNTKTYAPSNVKRFWFPDHYSIDSHSGAITSTFITTHNVECTLSDVVFYNMTSRNDTTSNSWGLGGSLFVLFTGYSTGAKLRLNEVHFNTSHSGGMGGGVNVVFDNQTAGNAVLVGNSLFYRCSSGSRAGGMNVVNAGNSVNNSVSLTNVTFDGCKASIAAGAFNFYLRQNVSLIVPGRPDRPSTHLALISCLFMNNEVDLDASAVQLWSFRPTGENRSPVLIQDCTFINNRVYIGSGAVISYEQAIVFRGRNYFLNNSLTALFLTHTSFIVHDTLLFVNNSGKNNGGGFGLVENSYIYMVPGSKVLFSGNDACRGPAAYINPGLQQGIHVVDGRRGSCSLQIADNVDLKQLRDGQLAFLANITFGPQTNTCPKDKAAAACFQEVCTKDLYVTSLNYCIDTYQHQDGGRGDSFHYETLPLDNKMLLLALSFTQEKAKQIVTDASALLVNQSINITGHPGQEISLAGVEVTDQSNTRTVSSVYMSVISPEVDPSDIILTPEVILVQGSGIQPPTFTVKVSESFYNSSFADAQMVPIKIQFILVDTDFTVRVNTTMYLRQCPPGFGFSETYRVCTYTKTSEDYVVAHDVQTGRIFLEDGFWGQYDNKSRRIFALRCPLFYCYCSKANDSQYPGCLFDPQRPNDQCNAYRTGALCGECRANYSTRLFGTACRTCSSNHQIVGWIVLMIFIVGTMVACCLVLYYNIGIAQEFLGVLFFLQTCYYASDPGSPVTTNWVAAQPDDDSFATVIFNPCIGQGWQPFQSVVMNYLLVVVGAFVISMVYLVSRRGWIKRFATRSTLDGVWLIFLLTYTSSTDTIFKAVRCVVADPNGLRRYYYNGEIYCLNFGGPNDPSWVPVGFLSLTMFLVAIFPTPFLMFLMSRGYFKRMKPFRDVIESSYVEERRWWAGVDILRRLALAVIYFISYNARQRQVAMVVMSFLLLLIHCLAMPYKKRWVNYSEAAILFDFFILSVLGLDGHLDRLPDASTSEVPGFIFLTLPLIYGLVLAVRHIYMKLHKSQDASVVRVRPKRATSATSIESSSSASLYQDRSSVASYAFNEGVAIPAPDTEVAGPATEVGELRGLEHVVKATSSVNS